MSEWYTEDVAKALAKVPVRWGEYGDVYELQRWGYQTWVRAKQIGDQWKHFGAFQEYEAQALIERALREWLEARRVFVHFGTPGDVWFIANQPPFFINSVLMGDGTWALECTDQSNHMKPDGYLAALAAAALAAEKEATP